MNEKDAVYLFIVHKSGEPELNDLLHTFARSRDVMLIMNSDEYKRSFKVEPDIVDGVEVHQMVCGVRVIGNAIRETVVGWVEKQSTCERFESGDVLLLLTKDARSILNGRGITTEELLRATNVSG